MVVIVSVQQQADASLRRPALLAIDDVLPQPVRFRNDLADA